MRLIINADDLGMSEFVNEATFSLMERGIVTSASILANAPAARSALLGARDFGHASFGVHLCLTEFAPVSGEAGLAPFLDDHGRFRHSPLRPALRPSVAQGIVREWIAQIELVRAGGVDPSHIDSHHHVHAHPYLFGVVKRVQRAADIRRVRIAKTINGPKFPNDSSHRSLDQTGLAFLQWATTFALRLVPPAKTSDAILSLMEFYQLHRAGRLARPPWTTARRDWTLELMVHPGHEGYDEENAILESGWLDELGHTRISYARL